ncbi:carbohydrate-binding protein [Cohnella cellulosilytica]|uniref:Carbohydrate-binding protein n=1 Tax=Cohnella cellulosilytica TaxID=986710 RepID=A0ABW2FCY7_9BACL
MRKGIRHGIGLGVALALSLLLAATAGAYSHPGSSVTANELTTIQSKVNAELSPWKEAYEAMLEDADDGLSVASHAIAIWNIPGYYADSAGHDAAKLRMEIDASAAYATALAYRFTGNHVYADKAKELINGWAYTNTSVTGTDGALVSAYLGVGLIHAADLIKDYAGWSATDQTQFTNWIASVWLPKWDGINGRNNWWDWSLYAQLSYYHFTDNATAFAAEVANLKDHIDTSIDANGFLPEEATRGSNSLWYHYFALSPMTAAAEVVRNATGEDLFNWVSPSGKSIKLALDTLFYYVNGHVSQWPYGSNQGYPGSLNSHQYPLNLYEAMAEIYQDMDYEIYVTQYRPVGAVLNGSSGRVHHFSWVYPTLLRTSIPVIPGPGYAKVEAEDYSGSYKVSIAATVDEGGGSMVRSTDHNDYVYYTNLNLGEGTNEFQLRYATPNTDGTVEFRVDGPDGPLLGSLLLPSTGSWTTYQTVSIPVTGAAGIKNVYMVFKKASSGSVADINWFSYTTHTTIEAENFSVQHGLTVSATSDTGGGGKLGKSDNGDYAGYSNVNFGPNGVSAIEVRYATTNTNATLELRSGGPTGTLLGSLLLPSTGSWDTYGTISIPVTGAVGVQDLYLVFKRPASGSVADVNWLRY